MAKKKPLKIEATSDLCVSLAWVPYTARTYLQANRPSGGIEAMDCRNSVNPIFDLMDQIGCRYLPKVKKELLALCKVQRQR